MTERPGAARGVLVITDQPLPVTVRPVKDERTPSGMMCLGTSLGGRVVARCVVRPEAIAFLEADNLFAAPVRLALAAEEAPPGLQCRLFALVTLPGRDAEPEEPWAASVPSSDFDRLLTADRPAGEDGRAEQAAVLLGHIVRFARDRRHPGHLGMEAADVLASLVHGRVAEVVDQVLEDLLDGGSPPP